MQFAGFVLYKGFFGSAPTPAPKAVSTTSVTTSGALPASGTLGAAVPGNSTPSIAGSGSAVGTSPAMAGVSTGSPKVASAGQSDKLLPYGPTFDVSKVIGQYNFQFGAYIYPVATSSDVGIDLRDLIKPAPKSSNSLLSGPAPK